MSLTSGKLMGIIELDRIPAEIRRRDAFVNYIRSTSEGVPCDIIENTNIELAREHILNSKESNVFKAILLNQEVVDTFDITEEFRAANGEGFVTDENNIIYYSLD